MVTDSPPEDGCGSCLSRRGLMTAALAASGVVATGRLAPASAGEARWNTVAERGDIKVGKGKVVRGPEGQPWIVTRPRIDQYRAFTAICTHQGCTISGVRGETIFCGCHGSKFSMRTGEVVRGPAARALDRFPARVFGRRIQVFG